MKWSDLKPIEFDSKEIKEEEGIDWLKLVDDVKRKCKSKTVVNEVPFWPPIRTVKLKDL